MTKPKRETMKNMLEHQIIVLENVSDNVILFRKELEKSTKWLNSYELAELKKWLLFKYQHKYGNIINEILSQTTLSKVG